MDDKQECMFCNGHGVVEEWSESLNDWKDETCQECGGTGFEDDPEVL
ncbi:hypothetical protein ACWQG8_002532 [Klebsiella pneumoniae]